MVRVRSGAAVDCLHGVAAGKGQARRGIVALGLLERVAPRLEKDVLLENLDTIAGAVIDRHLEIGQPERSWRQLKSEAARSCFEWELSGGGASGASP